MSVYITRRMLGVPVQKPERQEQAGKGPLRRLVAKAARNWKRSRMIAALNALDDRTLWDIGIDRSGIEPLVDSFDDRELGMLPVNCDTQNHAYGACPKAA